MFIILKCFVYLHHRYDSVADDLKQQQQWMIQDWFIEG